MSVKITSVVPGSPAFRAGIRPGEVLCTVDGVPIADLLDYRYRVYGPQVVLGLGTRRVLLRKAEGRDPGLVFDDFLMDRQRICQNRCLFCFVDQMPPGLRASLYLKDDDFRLSLLTGAYVTLTNLSEEDVGRICSQRLSPLCVSVHVTDPELRAGLLKNPAGGDLLFTLRRFADAGIVLHCQIVLCPGLNDGDILRRTLYDLLALAPSVASIAVVPVGLTRYRDRLPRLRPVTMTEAVDTLSIIADTNAAHGAPIVFASDELILRAGLRPWESEYPEDYPQLEDGVGMMALFAAQWKEALRDRPDEDPDPFIIATGLAAAPFLKELLSNDPVVCRNGEVIGVPNVFFGPGIDVSGLLTGQDLILALRGRTDGRRVLLPANMLRYEGDVFLDDMTPADLSGRIGVPVCVVPVDGQALVRAIWSL